MSSTEATTTATTMATTTATPKEPRRNECIDCDGCGSNNPQMNCARCKLVFYCGRDCQKRHWSTHKVDCIPIETMKAKTAGVRDTIPETPTEPALNTECGICLDDPMTNPVTLPDCRHAFCFACLDRLNQHHHSGGGGGTPSAPCPMCRTMTTTGHTTDIKEAVIEDAIVYISRASNNKHGQSKEDQQKWCDMALQELDKILSTNDEHIVALCAKAQALAICDPKGALSLYELILEIDQDGSEHLRKMNVVLDKVRIAMDANDEEEAEHLLDLCEEMTNETGGRRQQQIGQGPGRLFEIYLHMAQVHESLEDWTSAYNVYAELLKQTGDGGSIGTAPQQRKMFAGLSRCSYHLGQYDRALAGAQAALQMNRHFPGVHQLLARPLRAHGQLDEAREVMARAILYEAPWDEANRQEQLAYKKELDEAEA